MDDGNRLLRTLSGWGIPFAIVFAALGYETDWGRAIAHRIDPAATNAPKPVAVTLLPEYRLDGGVDARKETVDRVLFNPTRRPAPPSTAEAGAASSMTKGVYTLTGTTMIGNVATAFLREVKGGKSHTVRQGDKIGDLLVAEVKPDRVRLSQGSDTEDLQLKIAAGPKTTIQVAAPTPARPGAPNGVTPAGGSGAATAGNVRPFPAPRPPNPSSSPRAGPASVSEILAERRRAAREAAEAARAGYQAQRPPRR